METENYFDMISAKEMLYFKHIIKQITKLVFLDREFDCFLKRINDKKNNDINDIYMENIYTEIIRQIIIKLKTHTVEYYFKNIKPIFDRNSQLVELDLVYYNYGENVSDTNIEIIYL